jgi:hypothetical protein
MVDIAKINGAAAPVKIAGASWGSLDFGDAYGGGYYFGTIPIGGTYYHLICSDKANGETYTNWGSTGEEIEDSYSHEDGYENTLAQIEYPDTTPAAEFCVGLTIGGYSDWYLPSLYELTILYPNKSALEAGGSGTLESDYYWSSTESYDNYAFLYHFYLGFELDTNKSSNKYVRAIRRVAV